MIGNRRNLVITCVNSSRCNAHWSVCRHRRYPVIIIQWKSWDWGQYIRRIFQVGPASCPWGWNTFILRGTKFFHLKAEIWAKKGFRIRPQLFVIASLTCRGVRSRTLSGCISGHFWSICLYVSSVITDRDETLSFIKLNTCKVVHATTMPDCLVHNFKKWGESLAYKLIFLFQYDSKKVTGTLWTFMKVTA